MKKILRSPKFQRFRHQAGMALVVTLSLIVLVTIAVMAFFARATANRAIESSRANQVLAAQLSETAQDYIVGRFLAEMTNNAQALTSSGTTVYQVTNAAGMVPQRVLAQTAMTNNADFANLVRQSVPAADANASSDSVAAASQNGRTIGTTRWNAPQLNFGSGFSATNQLPNWIYVNRDGSVTATATTNAIGRFAYNVYETGGLLDANVAGNPNLAGADLQALKGTLAGADLSVIPGVTSVTNFVNWRKPGLSGPGYVAAVTNAAANGFLNFSSKDLASRQDLIRLAKTGTYGISTNALPYLTHFSRAVNAPSWGPQTNAVGAAYQYKDNATNAASTNPFLPNVRVKAAFTRRDGTAAKVGEQLIKTRFPLSKLAWLGLNGPVAPGTATTIQRDFGLAWDSANKRWNYVGHTGATVQTAIKTLDDVANDNREPNFFELLKAGTLNGSLGKASAQKTLSGINLSSIQTLEGNTDLQIARIGACLIDQADTDNFPTHINIGSITQHGVEDLPYLYGILTQERWRHDPWGQYATDAAALTAAQAPGGAPFSLSLAFTWVPKLWNPHATATPASTGPTAIRARISSGQVVRIQHIAFNASGNVAPLDLNTPTNLPNNTIEIPSANFDVFRNTARPPDGAFATSSLPSQLNWWNSNTGSGGDNYCGFVIHRAGPSTVTIQSLPGSPTGFFANVETAGAMVVLEYQDTAGNWHVYDTLAGNADLPAVTGITTAAYDWAYGISGFWARAQNNVGTVPQFSAKWDPRTPRWGPCHGWSLAPTESPQVSGTSGIRRNEPFSQAPPGDTPLLFGLWPQGHTDWNTAGAFTLVPGADGVFRPNDAYKGDAANPFRNMSDTARRPVILQRPFRSVGEMGYAFRDTPWQTLDLFDSTSADSALLDLFSAADGAPVSAGTTNLNRASATVLQSILAGTAKAPDGSSPVNAAGVAADVLSFRDAQAGKAILNKDVLPGFISSAQFSAESSEVIKGRREAVVRGLADVCQTGTWNLLVDVIVQSGRGASADRFVVEGESREWMVAAIDRLTGRVVARKSEPVTE